MGSYAFSVHEIGDFHLPENPTDTLMAWQAFEKAALFEQEEMYDSAGFYFGRAVAIYKDLEKPMRFLDSKTSFGRTYFSEEHYEEALQYFEKLKKKMLLFLKMKVLKRGSSITITGR